MAETLKRVLHGKKLYGYDDRNEFKYDFFYRDFCGELKNFSAIFQNNFDYDIPGYLIIFLT